MSQQNQETDAILMDTVISKLDQQDEKLHAQGQKIEAMDKRINEAPDPSLEIRNLKIGFQGLQKSFQNQKFPEEKIQELASLLSSAILALRQPVTNSVEHHHHIPKIIWIAVSLFLLVCVTAVGWGETNANLRYFMANDIKYRKLKLSADSASLGYLYELDSLYAADPDAFRNNVIEQERLKQERLELLDKAQSLEYRIDTARKKLSPLKGN